MYYYSGYALLGDLTFARNTKYVLEELQEAKKGIDKALLSSDMVNEVGIHYSQASLFGCIGSIGKSFWSGAVDSWIQIVSDLGLNFDFVSYEQLEKQAIDRSKYKVFILPVSVCLSEKEIDAIREYVAGGGVVIADYGAGIYDGHGKKIDNKRLLEVFGVERGDGNKIVFGAGNIKVVGDSGEGLGSREIPLRFGEKGLRITTGKVYGDNGTGEPVIIINRFGKGKAVLLNCVVSDYSQVNLSGGGEISEVKKGVLEVNEQVKGLMRDIFRAAGVIPEVILKTDKGIDFQSMTKTVIWKNGEIYYIGLLNEPEDMYSPIKPTDTTPISISFRRGGYLYDVRAGGYLGKVVEGGEIKTNIVQSVAKIYALLPYKVEQVEAVAGKESYKAGEVVKISAKVKTSGKPVGNHVVYVEACGPDKQIRKYYTKKVHLKAGEGVIEIPTAINDIAGRWSVMVKDVASGISNTVFISITK